MNYAAAGQEEELGVNTISPIVHSAARKLKKEIIWNLLTAAPPGGHQHRAPFNEMFSMKPSTTPGHTTPATTTTTTPTNSAQPAASNFNMLLIYLTGQIADRAARARVVLLVRWN